MFSCMLIHISVFYGTLAGGSKVKAKVWGSKERERSDSDLNFF